MLLAIDIGNTNTVFAVYDGEKQRGQWRTGTDASRTADEYAVWLTQLMALDAIERRQIDAAIIATVVPQAVFNLRSLCRKYFACEPVMVGVDSDLGIAVRVDRPHEVGADRLVNAVAAHKLYAGAVIVLDFGTATTFDVVDVNGDYRGGVIAPGVNLSLEALHAAAAALPRIAIDRPATVIGGGTLAAMRSGIYWGYVGLIEGILARIKAEFGQPMKTVATGGLAPLFGGACGDIDEVNADLTMIGLLEIYRRIGGSQT